MKELADKLNDLLRANRSNQHVVMVEKKDLAQAVRFLKGKR